jgi:ATP-dependent Lhr-like helicase
LTAHRLREAKQRVARRLRAEAQPDRPAPAATAGRWALVHRPGVLGPARSLDELAERQARVLLARYGVVARDCLEREAGLLEWARLYPVFQRLELRGEVRRGYFILGLAGAQFAVPEAVEALRAAPQADVIVLNAVDPANVYGGDLGQENGPRFARVPSTHVALSGGQPLVVFEDNGDRLTPWPDVASELAQRALQAYLARPGVPRRVVVSQWNGAPVLGSPGQGLLKALGFQNTPTGMEWWSAP